MDPLSLTASIITVLGAGGTVAKGLSRIRYLKNAPNTLLQLNNEVTDLLLLIRAVNELYLQPNDLSTISILQEEVVCNILERAKHAVLELEKLIEYVLTKETSMGTKVDTLAWSRALDRVKEAKNDIRAARNDLNNVWTALNNRHVSTRIELKLQSITTTTTNLQSNSLNVQSILDETAGAIVRLSETIQEERRRGLERITHPLMDENTEISRPFQTAGGPGNIEYPLSRNERSSNLIMELTELRKCAPYCVCCCHTQGRLQTPTFLSQTFGVLFTGYIGIPGLFASCNIESCRVRSPAKGHIFYVFPRWFLEMAVVIKIELSRVKGPEMLIRCLRVRDFEMSPNFQALAQDRYDQLKSLLSTENASVLDVSEIGMSLLDYSTMFFVRHPKHRDSLARFLELLLQEGADPFQEDRFLRSPYSELLKLSMKESTATMKYPFINLLLSQGDSSEALGFSELHNMVVRIDDLHTLKCQLGSISRDTMDQPDRTERTALSWAAEFGRNDIINFLLMKGADPNIKSCTDETSLLYCANDATCITSLLEAGANVDHADRWGRNKLTRLVIEEDNVECAEVLWRFGTNIDFKINNFAATIHCVVDRYRPMTLKWLLEKDTNIEACNTDGDTTLLCLLENSKGLWVDTLEILLRKRPDYNALNKFKEGLLHLIARYGSFQYINILTEWLDLSDLNVDYINVCGLKRYEKGLKRYEKSNIGKTAMELAEWRRDHQADWALDSQMDLDVDPQAYFEAFKSWIESIRAAHLAKTDDTSNNNAEASGHDIRSSGDENIGSTDCTEADQQGSRLRIPGSYPKEENGGDI